MTLFKRLSLASIILFATSTAFAEHVFDRALNENFSLAIHYRTQTNTFGAGYCLKLSKSSKCLFSYGAEKTSLKEAFDYISSHYIALEATRSVPDSDQEATGLDSHALQNLEKAFILNSVGETDFFILAKKVQNEVIIKIKSPGSVYFNQVIGRGSSFQEALLSTGFTRDAE